MREADRYDALRQMVAVYFLLLWSLIVFLPGESLAQNISRRNEDGDLMQRKPKDCHLPAVALSLQPGNGASSVRIGHQAVCSDGAINPFQPVASVPLLRCQQGRFDGVTAKPDVGKNAKPAPVAARPGNAVKWHHVQPLRALILHGKKPILAFSSRAPPCFT